MLKLIGFFFFILVLALTKTFAENRIVQGTVFIDTNKNGILIKTKMELGVFEFRTEKM